jgi:hypothetical protein
LGTSYVNNGGGQRLDVTEEGNVFMMFSPAEHTDSMKRRKERKRRERNERKSNEISKKNVNEKVADKVSSSEEQKSHSHGDVSSVEPTVVTPTKSRMSMIDSKSKVEIGNASSRTVSLLPVEAPIKNSKPQFYQITQHRQPESLCNGDNNNVADIVPTGSHVGNHRGVSSRVIIHESRGQSNTTSPPVTSLGNDNDSESSNGYTGLQQCDVIRTYCEEMPTDEDDMFYSKWCSFCVLDTNTTTKTTK